MQYTRDRRRRASVAGRRGAVLGCEHMDMDPAAIPARLRKCAAALLAAVVIIAGCASGGSQSRSGRTVAIDSEVEVGDIAWQVLEMRRTPQLQRQFAGATHAKGIFVVMLLRARRLSEAGSISSRALAVVDSSGREFPLRSLGRQAVDEAGLKPLGISHIAAQVPIEGWVAFDVARDSRKLRLQVGDPAGASPDVTFIRLLY